MNQSNIRSELKLYALVSRVSSSDEIWGEGVRQVSGRMCSVCSIGGLWDIFVGRKHDAFEMFTQHHKIEK